MALPNWIEWIFLALFVLFLTLFCTLSYRCGRDRDRRDREHIQGVFSSRTPISSSEFAAACPDLLPADFVERVRRVLAKVSDECCGPDAPPLAPPSRIAAQDLLHKDLGYWLDSLAPFELRWAVKKEFGIRIGMRETAGLKTAGDFALLVWRKLRAKGAS